jgi:hypothetical protein
MSKRRATQEQDLTAGPAPVNRPEAGAGVTPADNGQVVEAAAGDDGRARAGIIVNPFDPARIRIGVGYDELVATRVANPTFPVWNGPPKATWFMAHAEHEIDVYMLDRTDRDRDELYFVEKTIAEGLIAESTISPRLLVYCQTREGDDFLWAIKLKPPLDKRANSWTTSALQEKELARTRWVRHQSNRRKGCYEPLITDAIDAKPRWSELPWARILEIALKDRYIDSLDHEILVELRKGGKKSS